MRITVLDGRQLVGRFLAFDRHMNLVLGDAEEFRRLPPKKGVPEADREVRRPLGLVLIRGESVISLTVEGPPPTDDRRGKRDVAPVRAWLLRCRACQHPPLGFNLLSHRASSPSFLPSFRLPCCRLGQAAARLPAAVCPRRRRGRQCLQGWQGLCVVWGGLAQQRCARRHVTQCCSQACGSVPMTRTRLHCPPQISAAPQMGMAPGMRPPGMPPQFMPPPGSASCPAPNLCDVCLSR